MRGAKGDASCQKLGLLESMGQFLVQHAMVANATLWARLQESKVLTVQGYGDGGGETGDLSQ